MRPVIFDTDIGTDVDDILALVLLAKAPELNLLGVTTVYGDTNFRAKIARRTTQMLGRNDLKIVPGEGRPRSGRQVHWAGHEGEGIPNLDAVEIKHGQSGLAYICETAEALNGELEVIAHGKNIASGANVTALDSIEAGRWSTKFLVDNFGSRSPRPDPFTRSSAPAITATCPSNSRTSRSNVSSPART